MEVHVASGKVVLHFTEAVVGEMKVCSPWGPHVPVMLRIDMTGKVTSGNITARPPRRTVWQWLRGMRQHLADE
jgi:hypothetical protein